MIRRRPRARFQDSATHLDTVLVDGIEVPVYAFGGDSPEVFFLPGLGAHPHYYLGLLEKVAVEHCIGVPDLSFATQRILPRALDGYVSATATLLSIMPESCVVTGHSIGGLVALLADRPAIGLSPAVPTRIGWTRLLARAARLQLREYAGLEGREAFAWAAGILLDHSTAAVTKPLAGFPAVNSMLYGRTSHVTPTDHAWQAVLAFHDRLYPYATSTRFFSGRGSGRVSVVPHGHDWPASHPGSAATAIRGFIRSRDGSPEGPQ